MVGEKMFYTNVQVVKKIKTLTVTSLSFPQHTDFGQFIFISSSYPRFGQKSPENQIIKNSGPVVKYCKMKIINESRTCTFNKIELSSAMGLDGQVNFLTFT